MQMQLRRSSAQVVEIGRQPWNCTISSRRDREPRNTVVGAENQIPSGPSLPTAGDVVQNFAERWRGSPTDAVDHNAHRDSDGLAGGSFLRHPRHTQAAEYFSKHSLRERLSVNNFRSHAPAENFANVKIVDADFPPPARGTMQRDRKGLSDDLCVWIEPTLVTPTAGDDVAMQMLNRTHRRQPAHRNDGQCQPD